MCVPYVLHINIQKLTHSRSLSRSRSLCGGKLILGRECAHTCTHEEEQHTKTVNRVWRGDCVRRWASCSLAVSFRGFHTQESVVCSVARLPSTPVDVVVCAFACVFSLIVLQYYISGAFFRCVFLITYVSMRQVKFWREPLIQKVKVWHGDMSTISCAWLRAESADLINCGNRRKFVISWFFCDKCFFGVTTKRKIYSIKRLVYIIRFVQTVFEVLLSPRYCFGHSTNGWSAH